MGLLETQHNNCIAITLLSTAGDISTTFGEGVEAVRDSIVAETIQSRDVMVVGHSYGGTIA